MLPIPNKAEKWMDRFYGSMDSKMDGKKGNTIKA